MIEFLKYIFKNNVKLYKGIFMFFKTKFLRWKFEPTKYDFNAHCCYCGEFLARTKTGYAPKNCEQPFVTFWGPANKVPKLTITLCENCYNENVDDFTKENLKKGVHKRLIFKCIYCEKQSEEFNMSSIQYYDPGTDLVRQITVCNECYFPIFNTVKSLATDVGKFLPERNRNKIEESSDYY